MKAAIYLRVSTARAIENLKAFPKLRATGQNQVLLAARHRSATPVP